MSPRNQAPALSPDIVDETAPTNQHPRLSSIIVSEIDPTNQGPRLSSIIVNETSPRNRSTSISPILMKKQSKNKRRRKKKKRGEELTATIQQPSLSSVAIDKYEPKIHRATFIDGTDIDCTLLPSHKHCNRKIELWIHGIYDYYPDITRYNSKAHAPIGLAIKIDPHTRKIVLLQLCSHTRCLLCSIQVDGVLSNQIKRLFQYSQFIYVGVGIKKAKKWLVEDYGVNFLSECCDLRELAAERTGNDEMIGFGQRKLFEEVLGIEMVKREDVRKSRWEKWPLSKEQLEYACFEAFASFRMGEKLLDDVL